MASSRKPKIDIVVSESGLEVIGPAGSVALSHNEQELLTFLLRNRGIVLTPDTILSRVWGVYRVREHAFLAGTVASLNDALLRAGFAPGLIEDVHGVGYWLRPGSVTPARRTSQRGQSDANDA